jgi:hypothetical protein
MIEVIVIYQPGIQGSMVNIPIGVRIFFSRLEKLYFAPHAGECGPDFLFEAGDHLTGGLPPSLAYYFFDSLILDFSDDFFLGGK